MTLVLLLSFKLVKQNPVMIKLILLKVTFSGDN